VNQINSYIGGIWYQSQAKVTFPQVTFRYTVIPTGTMPGGIVPLNFTQSVLEAEIQMGKQDAANVIKLGMNGRDRLTEAFNEIRNNIIIP
jgi:hypothetical protein